jgi:nucleoside-diphosphate-sugar epimerase
MSNLIESYFYDIGKAERTFGWQPKYSFEDMLIDYRKEMDSGRFAYLIEKRRLQMQVAR